MTTLKITQLTQIGQKHIKGNDMPKYKVTVETTFTDLIDDIEANNVTEAREFALEEAKSLWMDADNYTITEVEQID